MPSRLLKTFSYTLQGFTPDRLSSSCCHTVPDFHLSSPAKNFFKKAAAALFGGKKDKARYIDTHSELQDFSTLLYSILVDKVVERGLHINII